MGQMTVEQWYGTIKTGLTKKLTENKEALPAGFNQQRFILNCITVIQDMMKDDKKKAQLEKINPETIPVCLAKAAYLGLDFFNGECYAIPYGGNLSFQTDYKEGYKEQGMKSLLRQVEKKVAEFGEGRVCDLIEECMSNNWKGIIWDKMTQIPQRPAGDRIQNRVSEVDNW